MEGYTRLFKQFLTGHLSEPEFLHRLDDLKTRQMALTRRWWKSPPAFEACWDEMGGFDEEEYQRRVQQAFSEAYSGAVVNTLRPVLRRRIEETPEVGAMLARIRGYLFSDVFEKAGKAETIEEVYFLIGEDLSHWLIVYLADLLAPRATPTH